MPYGIGAVFETLISEWNILSKGAAPMAKKTRNEKPKKKRTQFVLEAPEATHVAVTGSFCEWKEGHPLKKDKKGTWKTSVWLTPGRHEYRYLVDGRWYGDPASQERVPNPYGGENDVLVVTS
jgi:1,4-alpha-glucan branching enzyme